MKEQSIENLLRGRKIYEPPRFMTVTQCIAQLIEVEGNRKGGVCTPQSLAVGLARVGQADQRVVFGSLQELLTVDFGAPLHSVVLVGAIDEVERDMLDVYRITPDTPRIAAPDQGSDIPPMD